MEPMSTATATDVMPHRTTGSFFENPTVPAASPAWYGSVMGSAILGTLSELRTDVIPFGHTLAVGFWLIACTLLVVLTVSFVARIARDRAAFRASVANPVAMAQWGMVSMGVLAVGSATSAVLPAISSGLSDAAWRADLVLWAIGTVIGLATAVAVPARLLVVDPSTPTTAWGLAVVPPMVSATGGAGIVGWLSDPQARVWVLLASAACFFVALVLGVIIFAIAYRHHWLVEPLPLAASITAWLPLGVVGQSTAAAQAIARQSASMLQGQFATTVTQAGHVYGYVVLTIGVPLVAWALAMTVRGFTKRMPFSPGWWGMTFPVGTLVLGSTMLGRSSHHAIFTWAGAALYLFLLGTWSVCAISSLLAVCHQRALRHA